MLRTQILLVHLLIYPFSDLLSIFFGFCIWLHNAEPHSRWRRIVTGRLVLDRASCVLAYVLLMLLSCSCWTSLTCLSVQVGVGSM
jgi:hypothetical protein